VQAGHPHPLLLTADGGVELLGHGGLPIGLVHGGEWDRLDLHLHPGDRLFLMTDGLTECRNAAGDELGETGLTDMVHRNFARAAGRIVSGCPAMGSGAVRRQR
jgi:phosphoserine phosphatase RsbU/P